jgi:2-phosphosulfolactate phosphatase
MNEPSIQKSIEVCFSPKLFGNIQTTSNFVTVVVDILRATTSICAALACGAKSVIPVSSLEEAKEHKQKGFAVAAERDGLRLDFADFGNSAFDFMRNDVSGLDIVFSTTNGTVAMEMAKSSEAIVLGAFINLSALADFLIKADKNIVILCSGWKNMFCLEDSIFAGALIEKLTESKDYDIQCDSALASLDLWKIAKPDLLGYIQKAAHRKRLRMLGVDDVLEYCFTLDAVDVVPVLKNGKNSTIRQFENSTIRQWKN